MPSAVNTASKDAVNWPARSLIRNLTGVVTPGRIVGRDADHEPPDRGRRGRSPGTPGGCC